MKKCTNLFQSEVRIENTPKRKNQGTFLFLQLLTNTHFKVRTCIFKRFFAWNQFRKFNFVSGIFVCMCEQVFSCGSIQKMKFGEWNQHMYMFTWNKLFHVESIQEIKFSLYEQIKFFHVYQFRNIKFCQWNLSVCGSDLENENL